MLSTPSVGEVHVRDRVVIAVCLVLITALAWTYLLHLQGQMSSSMEHDTMMAEMGMPMDMPWTRVEVFFTFAMWAVMMVGMMTAPAAPVLLLFASAQRLRAIHGATFQTLMFGLGYLLAWCGFSACATIAQWALHEAALLSPAMAVASPRLGGAILLAAGAYQLTPLKTTCLAHCRSPVGFLMAHWRDGPRGALQMGARHGAYCLGCCWALMCVLFAVGVMNLMWVAALTTLVLIEKVGSRPTLVARTSAAALAAMGIALITGAVLS